jgi:hypothetical protein
LSVRHEARSSSDFRDDEEFGDIEIEANETLGHKIGKRNKEGCLRGTAEAAKQPI